MIRVATRADVQRLVGEEHSSSTSSHRPSNEDDHLPGASNLPLKQLAHIAPERLRRDRPVIVYCHDTI